LFDFAEAALGRNASMSWSISPDVLRRQIAPVFARCANRELSAKEACDVAMDFITARVSNMLDIFARLFTTLESRIDVQMHGVEFPALLELREFFLGLNTEAQWATDTEITRRELCTLFERVSSGEYSAQTGVCVFCDTITSKKEYYLELLADLCIRLTEQIVEAQKSQEAQTDPG
jgi:hypothetical protein